MIRALGIQGLAFAVLLPVCAWAAPEKTARPDAPLSGGIQQACSREIDAFCGDLETGGFKMLACLYGKRNDLSGACSAGVRELDIGVEEVAYNCVEDIARFCDGRDSDDLKDIRCLWGRRPSLTPHCRTVFDRVDRDGRKVLKNCRQDSVRHCQRDPSGSHRILKCLRRHQTALSAQCRREVGEKNLRGSLKPR
ncbi:MAG: cysteine rich repeat-containing protein [Elusimicrobiota bacterium]